MGTTVMHRRQLQDSKFGPTRTQKQRSNPRKYSGTRTSGSTGATDPKETIRALLRRYPARDRDEDESDDKKRQPAGLPTMASTKTRRD